MNLSPIRIKNGIAQFYSDQYHPLFPPSDFGYIKYEFIERPEYVTDFKMEKELQLHRNRPIHHYCPYNRFRKILSQLLGQTLGVCSEMMESDTWETIISFVQDLPQDKIYEGTRSILKHFKLHIYYNRIPAIAIYAGKQLNSVKGGNKFTDILNDFREMYQVFPLIKHKFRRSYFPHFRYVALKLLEKHGVEIPLKFPFVRCQKRMLEMDEVYIAIWKRIKGKGISIEDLVDKALE
jgi:hypothetical protein